MGVLTLTGQAEAEEDVVRLTCSSVRGKPRTGGTKPEGGSVVGCKG